MIEVVGEADVSKVEATEETKLESRRKNPVVGSSNLTSNPQQCPSVNKNFSMKQKQHIFVSECL